MRKATCLALLATAILAPAASAQERPLATCFWEGPISTDRPTTRGFDGRNFNFPEESATYWLARFNLPDGSRLVLRGGYPHGRYMSVNAYSDGAPTDALSDVDIAPDPGATNPFLPGARRDVPARGWTLTVLDEPVPSGPRAANTIYARPRPGDPIELAYRVYEPDEGRDLTGDTGLPEPELHLADGRVLRGADACAAINDPNREITVQTVPAQTWQAATRCRPGHPAFDPVRWERFFNLDYATSAVLADCTEAGFQARRQQSPPQQGGLYSNRDTAYIYAHLSRTFGEIVVLEGTLPVYPATRSGQPVMADAQLRFWSLCSGESRVTARTPDCLADRQVPIDAARRYTIVMSKAADRPANARPECGVAWLDWGERGDGAGRPDYGLLIMRNMLVDPDFAEAIQRVPRPGAEQATMGPYFPSTRYASRTEFEARGCPQAPPRACRSRLTIRAGGLRMRRVAVFAGKRRLAARRARGRRRVTLTLPRTRRTRVRVVVTTKSGRRVRFARRVPRCR
ncbi:MAG TPA: hypothetical protein VHF89_19165 [Solirubrobacteraceae bacterium]|nr:hypothetical protein [Solirubrobacteraceae bacterium]